MHKVAKAYLAEIACWKGLNDEQRGLLLAFTYCLQLRLDGVDFERHWQALCGKDRTEELGRDYYL